MAVWESDCLFGMRVELRSVNETQHRGPVPSVTTHSLSLLPCQTGWKENHATFVSELKSLQATGLSSFGPSLKEAFDLLNVHRLHTSIDHYGQVGARSHMQESQPGLCKLLHQHRSLWAGRSSFLVCMNPKLGYCLLYM